MPKLDQLPPISLLPSGTYQQTKWLAQCFSSIVSGLQVLVFTHLVCVVNQKGLGGHLQGSPQGRAGIGSESKGGLRRSDFCSEYGSLYEWKEGDERWGVAFTDLIWT